MTDLQKTLASMGDAKYADFQAKLAPTVERERCLGVRMPALRKFAGDFAKTEECERFLRALPHEYYDEDMLHAVLLSEMKPFDRCLEHVERYLPYIDNWASCDSLRPKVFGKNRDRLLPLAVEWAKSKETHICRFGVDMLMTYFLDGAFTPDLPDIPAAVDSGEYYVRMMVAWYFATALAKQWDAVIPYIEGRRLPRWTHNKAIQKSVESFRISDERKAYLKTLRY